MVLSVVFIYGIYDLLLVERYGSRSAGENRNI